MDWTGGAKSRFTKHSKNATTLKKQKAYFSKKRFALEDSAQQRHLIPSSFPGGSELGRRSPSHASRRPGADFAARSHRSPRTDEVKARLGMKSRHAVTQARSDSSRSSDPSARSVERAHMRSSMQRPPSELRSTRQSVKYGSVRGQKMKMTEEEELLMANRRRLLARSDWLGLNPLRPVGLQFPVSHHKDRIGKRRKLDRSQKLREHQARPRSITPVFHDRLMPVEPVMSGAMPYDDEIRIRIGTDAFASQTQRSLPSRAHRETSMRPPSTDLGPVSEESMLLGADGDSFESNLHQRAPSPVFATIEHSAPRTAVVSADEYREVAGVSPSMKMSWPGDETYLAYANDAKQEAPMDDYDRKPGNFYPIDRQPLSLQQARAFDHNEPTPMHPEIPDRTAEHVPLATAGEVDDEDEGFWRHRMHVNHTVASNLSNVALRSSSQHVTSASGWPQRDESSDQGPNLRSQLRSQHASILDLEEGRGSLERVIPPALLSRVDEHGQISPRIDLKQTTEGARPSTARRIEAETDENELWRQFVIGSQASDSSTSADHSGKRTAKEADMLLPPPDRSTSPGLNGYSDMATAGGPRSLLLSEVTQDTRDESLVRHRTTTSMVGHAPTTNFYEDDIEDEETSDGWRRKYGDVQTSSVMSLNPRRFKRSKKVVPRVSARPRYLPPRSIRGAAS